MVSRAQYSHFILHCHLFTFTFLSDISISILLFVLFPFPFVFSQARLRIIVSHAIRHWGMAFAYWKTKYTRRNSSKVSHSRQRNEIGLDRGPWIINFEFHSVTMEYFCRTSKSKYNLVICANIPSIVWNSFIIALQMVSTSVNENL